MTDTFKSRLVVLDKDLTKAVLVIATAAGAPERGYINFPLLETSNEQELGAHASQKLLQTTGLDVRSSSWVRVTCIKDESLCDAILVAQHSSLEAACQQQDGPVHVLSLVAAREQARALPSLFGHSMLAVLDDALVFARTRMGSAALGKFRLKDGRRNPDGPSKMLEKVIGRHYAAWVKQSNHPRDFADALAHCASTARFEHVMGNSSNALLCEVLELPAARFSQPKHSIEPKRRLYTDDDELNGDIKLDDLEEVLFGLRSCWVQAGNDESDLVTALREAAGSIHYSHSISQSLGGLGGGQDSETYLKSL